MNGGSHRWTLSHLVLQINGRSESLTLLNPSFHIVESGYDHGRPLILTLFGPNFAFEEESLLENMVPLQEVLRVECWVALLSLLLSSRWYNGVVVFVILVFEEAYLTSTEGVCPTAFFL